MRAAKRDLSDFWYSGYSGKEPVEDEYGNEIGTRIIREEPVKMQAVISPAAGYAQTEQFGNLDNYDKVLWFVTKEVPFDENAILWIDSEPTHNLDGDLQGEYIVRQIAIAKITKSQKAVSVAVAKRVTS